jgi:DNA mismatch repair protein MutS
MITIKDPEFIENIIPLFDYVYNDKSRDALHDFFFDMPASQQEVLARQSILMAMLRVKSLFISFSYSKSEFNESFQYLESLRIRNDESAFIQKLYYLYKKKPLHQEQGRLTQLYIFFYKINRVYFSTLNPEEFPSSFGKSISIIQKIFEDIRVEKNYEILRKNGFSISRMLKLVAVLTEKTRNGEMDAFWQSFTLFETYLSLCKGIRKQQLNFPRFIEHGIQLHEFYHPLLRNPVKNSLDTNAAVVLITGPNMSGKSTMLKAVGLCIYLGRLGLAVPADQAEFCFFDSFSIAINVNDDLKSGYSHFMTEIKTLKDILIEALSGKKCFAIFDELFRGTNAEDALAISRKTIEGLSRFRDSQFLISTHLQQLKESIQADDEGIGQRFIECTLSEGIPYFTYKLKPGWSDLKIGQIIFEQEGLNKLLGGTLT